MGALGRASWVMSGKLDLRHRMRKKLKVGARKVEEQMRWEGRSMPVDMEDMDILTFSE